MKSGIKNSNLRLFVKMLSTIIPSSWRGYAGAKASCFISSLPQR
jgi:hypothetical protein